MPIPFEQNHGNFVGADGIRPKGRKALRPYITGLIVTKKLTNFTRFVAQSLAPLHYRINL